LLHRGKLILTQRPGLAIDDHVGAKATKLAAKLALEVGIHGQSRGCDSSHHRCRDQHGQSPVFAYPGRLEQHAQEEAAPVHASPRSTTAGLNCIALRTAPALPRKVTRSAAQTTTASTTG